MSGNKTAIVVNSNRKLAFQFTEQNRMINTVNVAAIFIDDTTPEWLEIKVMSRAGNAYTGSILKSRLKEFVKKHGLEVLVSLKNSPTEV